MSCCCNKIYKFCKAVNGCNRDNFAALFAGVPDGNYTIQLDYLNSVVSIEMSISEGVVTFTYAVQLNENFTYTGQLLNESGEVVPIVKEEVSYDCFQFTTAGYFAPVDTPPEPGTQYIQDVIAGDNVSIDKTNPKKPVISATGTGGGDVTKAYVDAADEVLADAVALKEDAVNKVNDLNTPDSTTFPTTQAVSDALAEKADLFSGKIPTSQLPDSILGQVHYKGLYSVVNDVISSHDITINGQPLPAASASNVGWYFICTDGGTVSGVNYEVGDWIISNGDDGWAKVDNTDAVSSVNGKVGNVILNKGDIGLGNVPNVDATNPANISQGASYRFATDIEKAAWNNKFNLPALTSGSVLFSNGSTIAQDNSNLFWDNTNKRLGVGTNTPSQKLDVNGDISASRLYPTSTNVLVSPSGYTMMRTASPYNLYLGNVAYYTQLQFETKTTGTSPSTEATFNFRTNSNYPLVIKDYGIGMMGITTPTAYLNIAAGTAAAGTAPIKLAGGALMTTPEPGAIETDGTDLYWTNSSGTRKKITLT